MKKNVVRVLALVLVALMCLSLVPLAAHAQEHVHNYEPTRFEPTCSEDGYIQMYCEACGDGGQILEYIPPTGLHSFMNVEDPEYLIHEGDCEHAWQYWKSCSVCQQSAEEAYGKALDEMYEELNNRKNMGEEQDWETLIKNRVLLLDEKYKFSIGGEGHHYIHVDRQEATCTNDGWKEYSYCDVCGEYFNYEAIPAKGHRWGEFTQTKAPTCTEDGSRERVCEVCEVKEVEAIPALGHSWGEFTQTKAPTCTEDGAQERVCSVCGEKDVQVIPALGHRFGPFTVTKPATCTVDGEQQHVCTVCGFKETEAIPAAHKWGAFVVTEEPSCYASGTQERTCTVCGEKQRESIPAAHKFGEFVVTMEPTCYSSGEKRSTCSVCGETHVEWIDKVDHKFENGECVFCHIAMPEGYVAPSVETIETETTEPVTTENQTTEPQTTENQNTEPQTTENQNTEPQTTETVNEIPENAIYISFDGNGATGGSMADQAFAPGAVQALSANAFTREGYEFLGWDVAADGSAMGEERFLDGEAVELNADVTLYAQWKPLGEEAEPQQVETQQVAASAESVTSLETALNVEAIDPAAMVVQNVTPLNADGTKMSNEEVAARGGVIFDMPLPETYEPGHEIEIYHQNSETGEWERVTSYTVQGDKVVIWFRHFSDFAVLDRTALGNGLTPANNAMLGAAGDPCVLTLDANGGKVKNDADVMVDKIERSVTVGNADIIPSAVRDNYHFLGWCTDKDGHGEHFPGNSSFEYRGTETLYAQWAKNVTIDYKSNDGGTGFIESLHTYEGANVTLADGSAYTPKAAGASFVRWNTKYDGSGKGYNGGAEITVPGDDDVITLYAQWAKTNITVIFDINGDRTIIPKKQNIDRNSPIQLEKIEDHYIVPDGKRFKGWTVASTGTGTVYDNGGVIPANEFTEDTVLYAQFEDDNIIISYYKNAEAAVGETKQETAQRNKEAELLTLEDLGFEYPGFGFAGWAVSDAADAPVKYTSDRETIPATDVTANIDLYAVWRPLVKVTFKPNNGTSEEEEYQSEAKDNPTKLTAIETLGFTAPDNKEFAGWSEVETPAEGATLIADEAPYNFSEAKTFYAQWKPIKLKVTFDANNGTGSMAAQEFDKGQAFTLNKNEDPTGTFKISRTDYEFDGWNTVKEPTSSRPGKSYTDGDNISADDAKNNITLYAQWKQLKFKVKYDPNGGSGSIPEQEINTREETKLTLTKNNGQMTRTLSSTTHASFVGWKDQDGKSYEDGETIPATNFTKDLTLYAQWEVAIVFDKNNADATGTMEPQEIVFNEKTTLNKNTFDRANYKFDHWNTKADDSGDKYADEGEITPSDVLTLYAQWVKKEWSVTYDKNGGGGSDMAVDHYATGAAGTVKESAYNAPSSDKIFGGWKDVATDHIYQPGDDIPYLVDAQGEQIPVPADYDTDITLKAQWVKAVTISYHPGIGEGSYQTQDVPIGVAKKLQGFSTELDYKAPAGQTFAYWNGDDGKKYYNQQEVTLTDKLYLTADYGDTIVITYNANGGIYSTGRTERSFNAAQGKNYKLISKEKLDFSRKGYTFLGWALGSGAENPKYLDEDIVLGGFAQNTTLYAVWNQDAFEGIVTITGSVTDTDSDGYVGETLTADVTNETKFLGPYDYQWLRDGVEITGATNQTYTVTADDYGHRITCRVKAPDAKPDTKFSVNYKDIAIEIASKEIDIIDNVADDDEDYLYGLTDDMTYSFNSTDPAARTSVKSMLITKDGVKAFPFTKQGTYRFYNKGALIATVVVRNWYSLDYEITNRVTATTTTSKSSSSSGSSSSSSTSSTTGTGTVQMKNGSTVLSASSNIKDKSGNTIIKGNGTNAWLVREGANTDLKITVRPASNSYGFVYFNGSQWFTTGYEVTKSIEPIDGPEHYHIVFVNSQSSPKTADTSNLGLWSTLGFVSFVGLASILVSGRKRRNRG